LNGLLDPRPQTALIVCELYENVKTFKDVSIYNGQNREFHAILAIVLAVCVVFTALTLADDGCFKIDCSGSAVALLLPSRKITDPDMAKVHFRLYSI